MPFLTVNSYPDTKEPLPALCVIFALCAFCIAQNKPPFHVVGASHHTQDKALPVWALPLCCYC